MKAVFALALLCVIQVSLAQQQAEGSLSLSEATELVERQAREARAKKSGGKKGKTGLGKKSKKSGSGRRNVKKGKKGSGPKSKKSGSGRKNVKKGKKGSGNKSKKSGSGRKNVKKGKKGSGKKTKKSGSGRKNTNTGRNGNGRQAASCLADVLGKTKKFNKVQSEMRMVNRIISWKKVIGGKKANAANNTFGDALAALDESTNGGKECGEDGSEDSDTKKVYDKLKGCGVSAGSNCDITNITLPTEALLTECQTLLSAYSTDFKKCLAGDSATASATQCTCIQGLTVPKDACLDNATARKDLLAQKNKCTKGDTEGSFGDCRKAEREAAKAANKCRPKTGCTRPNKPTMTTAAPSGRVNFLKQLSQRHLKFNLH